MPTPKAVSFFEMPPQDSTLLKCTSKYTQEKPPRILQYNYRTRATRAPGWMEHLGRLCKNDHVCTYMDPISQQRCNIHPKKERGFGSLLEDLSHYLSTLATVQH
jgi:hypothetical protein